MLGRTKVSVSLPGDLVSWIDRGVRAHRYLSRSAAVEEALRLLERAQRDREIEEYYANRTEQERAEERAIGEAGYEALVASSRAEERRTIYGARRGPKRRRRR